MRSFVQRHQDKILGVLSGYDRLRFRGTISSLMSVGGMMSFLSGVGVLLKDFGKYAESLTQQLRQSTELFAQQQGRPVQYLPGKTNKEALVQSLRQENPPDKHGLIAVLSTLENCSSYDIHRNRGTQRLELCQRPRKCLHYYFYFDDPAFGQSQVRLQTWFPFSMNIVLNGREWLARQMDQARLAYLRADNCFTWVEDFERAQKLLDRQPRIAWPQHLQRLQQRVHPLHATMFAPCQQTYYWTIEQSEWATDVVFRDPQQLHDLYPALIRRGIDTFQSPDVMRFLGHKTPAHGGVHGKFAGQIISDLKQRPEGVRLKHRVGHNSIKMYDKQGSVLRVETTINDVKGLKVFRTPETQDPRGKKSSARRWLPLRKGVADMSRRARLSHSANGRYLETLSALAADTPLSRLTDKLCQPVRDAAGRRHRALNPLSSEDAKLFEAVSRGEHQITGFRNRDIRLLLHGPTEDAAVRRKQSGAVSRKLSLLRAHGLIHKIPKTHRYLLTKQGTQALHALLAVRSCTLAQLTPAA